MTPVKNILDIRVGFKGGRSYLKDTYFTTPFRVADVGEDRSDPATYLIVQSSSPGILDNDHYDISVRTVSGSRLQLRSQSYQRLFDMKAGAQQDLLIALEPGSSISYVQHPIVPQANSSFAARNVVQLGDDCAFTYGEIITCGRKLSGERFRFRKFQNVTSIYHNGRIILKDNILLEPTVSDIHSVGMLEGFTHQATLIHVHTGPSDFEQKVAMMHDTMTAEEDIEFGISQPAPNVIVIRALGNGGEQLFSAFRHIDRELWNTDGPEAPLEVDLGTTSAKQ